jgi:hypothetical protein
MSVVSGVIFTARLDGELLRIGDRKPESDRTTTYLAILDIALVSIRYICDHGNGFTAIRALNDEFL